MHLKRVYQFMIVYAVALAGLFGLKFFLQLSDYIIPGPGDVWRTGVTQIKRLGIDVLDTLGVAMIGHVLSIVLAAAVGIVGSLQNWMGALIKIGAYNLQAYPIVAVAPIIFILLGDGLSARLVIAALICYFPLLLAFIGVLSKPVAEIEHFFESTQRMHWGLQVKIRTFESMAQVTTVIAGSATFAMVGTIVAEFVGADAGIGYRIRIALFQNNMSRILVALFLIGLATSVYLAVLEWLGAKVRHHWNS